jgi:hypothetical protein
MRLMKDFAAGHLNDECNFSVKGKRDLAVKYASRLEHFVIPGSRQAAGH